jgi:predicted O-methyltransferase YrrM
MGELLLGLPEILERAYEFALQHIDLTGCSYGKPHWPGPYIDRPQLYYYFLAGLVALRRSSRVLELGTHFGGAIFSVARAMTYQGNPSPEIVTVDLRARNTDAFNVNPAVTRLIGNCLDPAVAERVGKSFSGPVDVMFVDVTHEYEHTKRCLDIYVPLVAPALVILDDIRLNSSMARLWTELSNAYGDRALDITECSRREPDVGFGMLLFERLDRRDEAPLLPSDGSGRPC